MKAIGYKTPGPITDNTLVECDIEIPTLGPHDLLVEVRAISVNPVDIKVREKIAPPSNDAIKVIGYDAAGTVKAVGSSVSLFNVGDEVFYAGDLTRAGTNSEFHAVDERIVGKKPSSLNFAESAALALTSITAWEILFDSFALNEDQETNESLLIIGGAGGVGSILIQLAKQLTNLTVIATASRPETVDWVKKMGADYVVDHRQSLGEQINSLGLTPRYVASLTASGQHFNDVIELIKPRGHLALIDDPGPLDISIMKRKALTLSWEFMFTRSMFNMEDMQKQYELLNRVSALVDQGKIITTMTNHLGAISAQSLQHAHTLQASGKVIGKNVLEGF